MGWAVGAVPEGKCLKIQPTCLTFKLVHMMPRKIGSCPCIMFCFQNYKQYSPVWLSILEPMETHRCQNIMYTIAWKTLACQLWFMDGCASLAIRVKSLSYRGQNEAWGVSFWLELHMPLRTLAFGAACDQAFWLGLVVLPSPCFTVLSASARPGELSWVPLPAQPAKLRQLWRAIFQTRCANNVFFFLDLTCTKYGLRNTYFNPNQWQADTIEDDEWLSFVLQEVKLGHRSGLSIRYLCI